MIRKVKIIAALISLAALQANNVIAEGLIDGKVYGRIVTSIVSVDQESIVGTKVVTDTDNWQIASNASRLGFKGKTELADGLSIIYQIEYEISTDDGLVDGDEFRQRNTVVGLQGALGTLIFGKHDTPFKKLQYGQDFGIDLFDDLLNADNANVLKYGDTRHNNILMYKSPEMNGVSASVAVMPGEEAGADARNDGIADSLSASIKWHNDNLYLAVAIDSSVLNVDAFRLASHYRFNNKVELGLMYQSGEAADENATGKLSGEEERDGWILSAAVPVGSWKLGAQIGASTLDRGQGLLEDDVSQIALRADYVFNKRTKIFTYMSNIETETGELTEKDTVFGLGIYYNF